MSKLNKLNEGLNYGNLSSQKYISMLHRLIGFEDKGSVYSFPFFFLFLKMLTCPIFIKIMLTSKFLYKFELIIHTF